MNQGNIKLEFYKNESIQYELNSANESDEDIFDILMMKLKKSREIGSDVSIVFMETCKTT